MWLIARTSQRVKSNRRGGGGSSPLPAGGAFVVGESVEEGLGKSGIGVQVVGLVGKEIEVGVARAVIDVYRLAVNALLVSGAFFVVGEGVEQEARPNLGKG